MRRSGVRFPKAALRVVSQDIGMVFAGGVDGQLAEELAGGCVDNADVRPAGRRRRGTPPALRSGEADVGANRQGVPGVVAPGRSARIGPCLPSASTATAVQTEKARCRWNRGTC
jgi:hypothetical protein